jgi:superfamily II DNA/RNA helicase
MAFILPSLIHLGASKTNKFPRILVLAPTRELAIQIKNPYDVFRDTGYSTVIYGG